MNSLEIYYERGMEKGMEKGRIETKEEFVRNLLETNQFTISQIANYANVSESFVRKIKASKK